jgi:hypothetical protein
MQVSLKDDEEAKGEAPLSERNESSENNDSSAAQSEKIKIPLIQTEKSNDFNIVEEQKTPVINTHPVKY